MTEAGYLGSNRAIDWDPGIPGGIPDYPNSNKIPAQVRFDQLRAQGKI